MKKIFVFGIVYILFSCSDNHNFEDNLTIQNDISYWILKVEEDNGNYKYLNSQFVFFENGESLVLSSFEENVKGTPSIINLEGSSLHEWNFNGKDSIFQICSDCFYKVKRYTNDSIKMVNKIDGKKFILVRKKVNI